jgi:glutamate synthase (NADPH/NADH) small chain
MCLGIIKEPVAIENIEKKYIERGFAEGWIKPQPPLQRTGKTVAVIGSGPAGLAAAQQLNRAGHIVTVFERDNAIGGLLRYGIPNFKLEKGIIDRRVAILEAEGIIFKTNINVGVNYTVEQLNNLTLLFYAVDQLKKKLTNKESKLKVWYKQWIS